jgi:hypothetical protein
MRQRGAAAVEQARARAAIIPMGQPILLGHHSERRDRNYRAKIARGFERGFEAMKEGEALARRAEAAEDNRQISSDDPEALSKLDEKLAELTRKRDIWKAVNKAVRSKDPRAGLAALGCGDTETSELLEPDFAGRVGIPSYKLTNLGAEIRRLEARKLTLGRAALPPETIGEVEIRDEDNRVRVFFPGKPADATRQLLKAHGFRWSPTEGAWQRQSSPDAWYWARHVARKLVPEAAE